MVGERLPNGPGTHVIGRRIAGKRGVHRIERRLHRVLALF